MPSSAHQSPAHISRFWPAIIQILLVEVIVLLALSGAIVGYLNWSSEAAWAEFNAASQLPAPEFKQPGPGRQNPNALRSESVSAQGRAGSLL